MSSMSTLSDVSAQLIADGVITDDAVLTPVTGGVSCEVWRVSPDEVAGQYSGLSPDGIVVKAPLARLRVPTTWRADVSRGTVEAVALRTFEHVTPGLVPHVLWSYEPRHAIAMTAAPVGWEEWRHQLSSREPEDPALGSERISRTCTVLGHTLATWHVQTQDIALLPSVLTTGHRLRELRTDPFHRAAASELPEVASQLRDLADELEAARTCLVHGDYSPKNVLVAPPDSSALWVLDAEVAHVGNPALDVAFLSAHLMLKAVWRPELRERLNAGRLAFEESYGATSRLVDDHTWSRQTGAILAARVCGVSRANYLSAADRAWIVPQAELLIAGQVTLDEAWRTLLRGPGF
jgi:5-methylthioribose kinase